MKHAHRVLCGVLFFGGMTTGLAQTPAGGDRSADACPATIASVRQKCGCDPREEAVFNSLAQTKLNSDNLRSWVTNCFMADGSLSVDRVKLNGKAALTGCLLKGGDQYPQYREALVELTKATSEVPQRKRDMWLNCYARELNVQGARAPVSIPPKNSRALPPAASHQSPVSPSAPTALPGIEQHVEANGNGRVTTGGVEATDDGKSRSVTIRQVIKASDQGVITTGPIKAHVGP